MKPVRESKGRRPGSGPGSRRPCEATFPKGGRDDSSLSAAGIRSRDFEGRQSPSLPGSHGSGVARPDGSIVFYDDIYGYDEELDQMLLDGEPYKP